MASSGGFGRARPGRKSRERYGPPTTCYNRFGPLRKAGVWDRLLEPFRGYDGDIVMIDSTVSAFTSTRPREKGGWRRWRHGTFRGGLTSKIHALVDAEGRPVNLRLTGGQIADCTEADALTDELGEGDILLADKGYDSNAIRAKAAPKAWPTFRRRPTERGHSFSRAGSIGSGNLVERSSMGSTVPRHRNPIR